MSKSKLMTKPPMLKMGLQAACFASLEKEFDDTIEFGSDSKAASDKSLQTSRLPWASCAMLISLHDNPTPV